MERRVGRLLERNTRAARLFEVQAEVDAQGCTQLRWTKAATALYIQGCPVYETGQPTGEKTRLDACEERRMNLVTGHSEQDRLAWNFLLRRLPVPKYEFIASVGLALL